MSDQDSGKRMGWGDLLDLKRLDIRALHKTWFAFFLTFFVWFNMAPLVTTIVKETGFTMQQLKLLAICNVALTVPGRVVIGMLSDKFGPRKTFSVVMVAMALPCFAFAFGSSYTQMLVSRLLLSIVGTGFVVGIHMTTLWFKPRDIGFAQGVEAGLGNWGSSIAAMTIPIVALNLFGGANGWRYSIAASGLAMLVYGIYYWFSITDGPPDSTYSHPKKAAAIEVSSWASMVSAIFWTIPVVGVLAILVWRIQGMGFMSMQTAYIAYAVIAAAVLYQLAQILHVNIPILKRGVPTDDRYRFTDVACLCTCYVATFGAELGVISMLPAFFQKTFHLTPQMAGLIGATFAFLNFFSRALGGYISDRSPTRRSAMLVYLAGIKLRADGDDKPGLAYRAGRSRDDSLRHVRNRRVRHHIRPRASGQAAPYGADIRLCRGVRQCRRDDISYGLHLHERQQFFPLHRGDMPGHLRLLSAVPQGTLWRVLKGVRAVVR